MHLAFFMRDYLRFFDKSFAKPLVRQYASNSAARIAPMPVENERQIGTHG